MNPYFEKSAAAFFLYLCIIVTAYFLRELLACVVQKPELLSNFCLNRIFFFFFFNSVLIK